MKQEGNVIQFSAAILACAVILRLLGGSVGQQLGEFFFRPETISAILFLETGRVLRVPEFAEPSTVPTEPEVPETTVPLATEPESQPLAVFAPDDARLVEVNSVCGYDADLPSLLLQPLSWDLTGTEPTVLILHTHGTESYTPTGTYTESSPYRTLDVGYNVVSVGDRLVQLLQAGGVQVLHDRTLHDYPSYNNSYNQAREHIRQYLDKYPSIRLVLDLHRDSVENAAGEEMRFVTQVNGNSVAQLMLVVGTDAGGLTHPDWPENMSLAVKLHARLEKNAPGICRPISFRTQRFNQDLSPGALIVEVGSAGNSRQEALLAVEQLSKAILDLSAGTGYSTS